MTQPFTLYVMQSAHTDIGYTHPQEQIMTMYLDHYDRVLEYCRQTARAQTEHRFKWTCETFWQVEHYFQHRPERLEEFLSYVNSGQIEVTGAYLHFTDLIDADAYRRSVEIGVRFCREHNIPLRTAMHCDINGWPWAVADILPEAGIPFFCSQVHIDNATDPLGARGSAHYQWLLENPQLRKDTPIRIPQAFWWEGPAGGRVLHWLNEHYLLGNVLGISSPQPFGTDKTRNFYETDRATIGDIYARAQREVTRYVDRLRADGYTRDKMLVSTGGFYVDNSRPDLRWCGVIERWNAEHDDIKMRTSTLGEWYNALLADGTDALPTYHAAWPDHWAHGLGSGTARMAQARRTQRRRPDVSALVEQSADPQAKSALTVALQQERLAVEHTFDAWSTTARPEASVNDFQKIIKEATFHRAELNLDEAASYALHALIPAADETRLYVYSQAEPTGDDTVRLVHFDAGDTQIDAAQHVLVSENGTEYAVQTDLEPLRQFTALLLVEPERLSSFQLAPRSTPRPHRVSNDADLLTLTGDSWRLRIDPHTGGLQSLIEGGTGREWVAPGGEYAFGQLVHEAVTHPAGREAVGNLARIIALDMATDEARRYFADAPLVEHSTLAINAAPRRVTGDVYDALRLSGSSERLGDVAISWRAYHGLPLVELVIDWHKRWSDLPEAAYVAFPFAAPDGALKFITGGGTFTPGQFGRDGQLPGTVSQFYTVQEAARISTPQGGRLLWLPLDAPLVMPNAIDYNRWEATVAWKWNGFLASMPVNHYWHTNFPTSQRGFIRLRYRLMLTAEYQHDEQALQAALPLDAMGWR